MAGDRGRSSRADRGARPAPARRSPHSCGRSIGCCEPARRCPTRRRSCSCRRSRRSATTSRRTSTRPLARTARAWIRRCPRCASSCARATPPPAARTRDGQAAAAHRRHDARVALHPAHERGRPRDPPHRADGDRRRDPRHRRRQARLAPVAVARAARSADRGGRLQRIGLSATQKPRRGRRAAPGRRRSCRARSSTSDTAVDSTSAIEIPETPLSTVCSNDTWTEIVRRMAELIRAHRTTLVFVSTRKARRALGVAIDRDPGEDRVRSHHGSLARERRLEAEERLKAGNLSALVATASLELGIDIGDVDLVLQIGATPSIAVFMQRVGRSGHALGKTPKGRLFPLNQDDLVCAAALLDAVRLGELDRTPMPGKPLDILAQQVVAACVSEPWSEDLLFETFRRAWPYRDLAREDFDAIVALHSDGRYALLHRDGVNQRLRATKRARITALTSGGAIPDTGQYRVQMEPGRLDGRNSGRGLRHRVQHRGHLSARQRLVAHPPGRARAWCVSRTRTARHRRSPSGSARRRPGHRSCRPRLHGFGSTVVTFTGWLRRSGYLCPPPSSWPPTSRRASGRWGNPDPRARGDRALLRRVGRHAARAARAVRRPHQPCVGPGTPQALLSRLRLRAAGRGQRGSDRDLARAAAQLPAGGRLRLPAPQDRPRPARPGVARSTDVHHALAVEPVARAAPVAHREGSPRADAAAAHARGGPLDPGLPSGAGVPRDAATR